MSISQNQALFSLLGTYYGGDGVTTFALPDLRGKAAISQGNGFVLGQVGGSATTSLSINAMPNHTHTATTMQIGAVKERGEVNLPTDNFSSHSDSGSVYGSAITDGQFLGAPQLTVGVAGAGQPIPLMNPYTALTCCIALQGIYPSRS
jgi:microcystin-dependent protein